MSERQRITFTGSQGAALDARLDLPASPPRAYALFAHCFTCGKDVVAASRISQGLVAAGFGVLRFDFTGLGSSDGDFGNTNFSSNIADLLAAADHLRTEYSAPALLVGHSLGGAAVLAAAGEIPEVAAVATIGAPDDPGHVGHLFAPEDIEAIGVHGEATVTLAGREFCVRKQFFDDIASSTLHERLASLSAALLVMHSPIDELVDIDNARRIYEAARHPKSFVSLDGVDHLVTRKADAAYVATVLSAWASRYIPTAAEPEAAPSGEAPPEGSVLVAEAHTGPFAQEITAGNHKFLADEPIGVGGDTGPNPYELLLAGLGACTAMTIRMYADRKKMPLEHVEVTLSHARKHADDCADVEGACRVERIERHIEVRGDLSNSDRAKILEIADKCPVHRTLEGDLRVVTKLV